MFIWCLDILWTWLHHLGCCIPIPERYPKPKYFHNLPTWFAPFPPFCSPIANLRVGQIESVHQSCSRVISPNERSAPLVNGEIRYSWLLMNAALLSRLFRILFIWYIGCDESNVHYRRPGNNMFGNGPDKHVYQCVFMWLLCKWCFLSSDKFSDMQYRTCADIDGTDVIFGAPRSLCRHSTLQDHMLLCPMPSMIQYYCLVNMVIGRYSIIRVNGRLLALTIDD